VWALLSQVREFLGCGARQFVFMLKGLRELQPKLEAAGIPFFLLQVRLATLLHTTAATQQSRRQWGFLCCRVVHRASTCSQMDTELTAVVHVGQGLWQYSCQYAAQFSDCVVDPCATEDIPCGACAYAAAAAAAG
jgi:hypothetical protein